MDDWTYCEFLKGNVSGDAKRIFFEELEHDPVKKEEFLQLKSLWDLQQIGRIRISSLQKQILFRRFWHFVQTSGEKSYWYVRLLPYAAALVLALFLGLYTGYLLRDKRINTHKEFYSENGSISTIVLDDGSRIWLNANTKLILNETEDEIKIALAGEAFFDIRHDETRTLTVDIGEIRIRDIGTRFNISAYPDDQYYRTTLIEGKVTVFSSGNKKIRELSDNQTFRFDTKNNSYVLEKIDPRLITGWTKNKFVFIDLPLSDICKEIEKWYGVSIVVGNKGLLSEKYTSVILRTTTVKQLMEMFKLTTGINYKIEEKEGKKAVVFLNK